MIRRASCCFYTAFVRDGLRGIFEWDVFKDFIGGILFSILGVEGNFLVGYYRKYSRGKTFGIVLYAIESNPLLLFLNMNSLHNIRYVRIFGIGAFSF